MIAKHYAVSIVFIILSFTGFIAAGQPVLPDIAGYQDNGIVTLSWTSQYSAIKTIAVMRSSDSLNNYATIGNVKKPGKGVQTFEDSRPLPGKNFYRLIITFSSGVTWTSNHCSVPVPASAKNAPAPNDSLKRVITRQRPATPGKSKDTTCITPPASKQRVSISFDPEDVNQPDLKTKKDTVPIVQQRHKINISADDPETNPAILVKSRFISADPVTGHINMTMPDDVNKHHYSIKFYDAQNHMVVEVPRIKAVAIIFDKRNFQHSGIYKFILRKDVTELETGYITIR